MGNPRWLTWLQVAIAWGTLAVMDAPTHARVIVMLVMAVWFGWVRL